MQTSVLTSLLPSLIRSICDRLSQIWYISQPKTWLEHYLCWNDYVACKVLWREFDLVQEAISAMHCLIAGYAACLQSRAVGWCHSCGSLAQIILIATLDLVAQLQHKAQRNLCCTGQAIPDLAFPCSQKRLKLSEDEHKLDFSCRPQTPFAL